MSDYGVLEKKSADNWALMLLFPVIRDSACWMTKIQLSGHVRSGAQRRPGPRTLARTGYPAPDTVIIVCLWCSNKKCIPTERNNPGVKTPVNCQVTAHYGITSR
jgi:hypothetical protein